MCVGADWGVELAVWYLFYVVFVVLVRFTVILCDGCICRMDIE